MMKPEPSSENSAYTTLLSFFVKTRLHRSACVAHAPVSPIARASAMEKTVEPNLMPAPANRNALHIYDAPPMPGTPAYDAWQAERAKEAARPKWKDAAR
jgi:hypothetical protein